MRLWPEEAERAGLAAPISAATYSADAGHRVYLRMRGAGLDADHFYLQSYGELYRVMGEMVDAGILRLFPLRAQGRRLLSPS